MSRVKNATAHHKKVKKILKQAKGYRGGRSKLYRTAKEAVIRGLSYSYIGRKHKKRNFRKLWIMRINAAVQEHDLSYNKFINGIKKAKIDLNRKLLSEMAQEDKHSFKDIVNIVKKNYISK